MAPASALDLAQSRRLTRIDADRYVAMVGDDVYTVERRARRGWYIEIDDEIAVRCQTLRQARRILAAMDSTLAPVGSELD